MIVQKNNKNLKTTNLQRHVLFVCHGNIHRSAIAEAVFRKLIVAHDMTDVYSTSSQGLCGASPLIDPPKHNNLMQYPEEWAASAPCLAELGIDITAHIARPVTGDDIAQAAVIISMEKRVLDGLDYSLVKLFPEARPRMRLFLELDDRQDDIPDMSGNLSESAHREVIVTIHDVLNRRFDRLVEWIEQAVSADGNS